MGIVPSITHIWNHSFNPYLMDYLAGQLKMSLNCQHYVWYGSPFYVLVGPLFWSLVSGMATPLFKQGSTCLSRNEILRYNMKEIDCNLQHTC